MTPVPTRGPASLLSRLEYTCAYHASPVTGGEGGPELGAVNGNQLWGADFGTLNHGA